MDSITFKHGAQGWTDRQIDVVSPVWMLFPMPVPANPTQAGANSCTVPEQPASQPAEPPVVRLEHA